MTAKTEITPLTPDDLDVVIAIDKKLSGSARRGFFEKRLAATLQDPGDYVYVGLRHDGQLAGFALARLLHGEFGQDDVSAALDAFGVDPDHQHKGAGHELMNGLEAVLAHKGVSRLGAEVDWADSALLSFFGNTGFALAPRSVLARTTSH